MKKKFNIYRVVWISCLFLLLIVILIMVMDYKINYEYQNKTSKKIYFYDCGEEICTTEVKDNIKKEYSTYDCWYESCPTFKGTINKDFALLKEDTSFILYNYKTGNTITSGYDSYTFINNEYIIVTKDTKDGIININDDITVDLIYEQIGYFENDLLVGYNSSNIIATKNGKYGIISYKDGTIIEEFKYEETQIQEVLNKININE